MKHLNLRRSASYLRRNVDLPVLDLRVRCAKTFRVLLVLLLLWGCESQDRNRTPPPAPEATTPSETLEPIPPPRAEDWHLFMHDLGFSGVSPDTVLTPPLAPVWKFKTGGPLHASPVIAHGTLYIGSTDGKLYALEAKRWGLRWVFDAGSPIRQSAAVLGNRVYFSARNNKVYALDTETGEKIWEFRAQNWMESPPVVANESVYVGAFPSKIYQLNARTGTLETLRERTIHIQGVEYGCANGVFRPVFPEHNAKIWRAETTGSEGYPVTANRNVYIGARSGELHAFDAATKTETWRYRLGGAVAGAPAVSAGMLYAAADDGYVYAFTNDTDAPPAPSEPKRTGVVLHDSAPVYTRSGGTTDSAVLLQLNDGVQLPILNATDGWYEIALPNGARGWMDRFALGEFTEIDGIRFNRALCRAEESATVAPEQVRLIEGAEVPQWSPDGELIAFLKREDLSGRYWRANEVWVMDRKGERARKLYDGTFYNPHVSWSLDSRLIAFEADEAGERQIYTADWKLGRVKQLVQGDAPAFSPSSNRLVFRRRDDSQTGLLDAVYRVNSDGSGLSVIARVPIARRKRTYTYLPAPVWAPDGTRVAFGVNNSKYVGVRIQSLDGQRIKEVSTQHQQVHQIRWAADGTRLAYVLSGSNRPGQQIDKQLHISETVSSLTQSEILEHTSPSWSPTGKRLAYMEREDCAGLRWKVWFYDLESGKRYAVARTPMKLTSVVWMPDGVHLCLWHTSDYLRDNAYKPALTQGWIVPVSLP